MLSNIVSQHTILTVSSNFPAANTGTVENNSCDKQMEIKRELSFKGDKDFQSFLLPLEQDFTKSSKGYASLLATISNTEEKYLDKKNKLEGSEKNKTVFKERLSDTVYLKNTSEHNYISTDDNSYYEKITQFIKLDRVENDQFDESMFSKNQMKIIHNSQSNSLVFENDQNVLHLENFVKTTEDFSLNFTNLDRFNCEDDDSSDAYETDSSDSGSKYPYSFDDESSSDDSVIFCEKIGKNESCCSSMKMQQTLVMTINSNHSESLSLNSNCQESGKSTLTFSPKDFELYSAEFLENTISSQKHLYDQSSAFNSGYINAGFEDDDFLFEKSTILKNINDSWNDSMKNISGEPHESKKVAFVPMPDLVSVYSYEAENDSYRYSTYVLDQIRFQNRIKDFESIIAPYLTLEHRASIYKKKLLLKQRPL